MTFNEQRRISQENAYNQRSIQVEIIIAEVLEYVIIFLFFNSIILYTISEI